jgi:hypothetical protein
MLHGVLLELHRDLLAFFDKKSKITANKKGRRDRLRPFLLEMNSDARGYSRETGLRRRRIIFCRMAEVMVCSLCESGAFGN